MGLTVPVASPASTAGMLADWEFEGNGNDSSAYGRNLTVTPAAYYVATPALPPSCNIGAQQTFRAGYPGSLDGSNSRPLDGRSTLTYQWQQVRGVSPVAVRWLTSQNIAAPSFDGMIFGGYNFQLTVTDGSGQSTACVVHDGAVAEDNNGVVIYNSSIPAAHAELLGPQIAWGRSPWPYMDVVHKYMADQQVANMDPVATPGTAYTNFYDAAAAGTVTVTAGSAVLTGVGTHFTTDFCNGPGDPGTSRGVEIIVWWPNGTARGGRRAYGVTGCTSDTQLTINNVWWWATAGSGLHYSIADNTHLWYWNNKGAPQAFNYLDNIMGLYAMYYRSGIDTYINAGRQMADWVWNGPSYDQGFEAGSGSFGSGNNTGSGSAYGKNAMGLAGLVLRATDTAPPENPMWPGLGMIANLHDYLLETVMAGWGIGGYGIGGDLRDLGFRLAPLNYCALWSPITADKANCQAALSRIVNGLISQSQWPVSKGWGGWGYTDPDSDTSAAGEPNKSVTLTHGQTGVTGANTSWLSTCGTGTTCPIWFWHADCCAASSRPGYPPGEGQPSGDVDWYLATVVSNTQITLDRTYAGADCSNCGYALVNHSNDTHLGYGANDFFAHIFASQLYLASLALTGTDAAAAAKAKQFTIDENNWVISHGWMNDANAFSYGVGFINCPQPLTLTGSYGTCLIGGGAAGLRNTELEGFRGLTSFYRAQPDAPTKAFVDTIFNSIWAKPGSCPQGSTVCIDDPNYSSSFDPALPGFQLTGGGVCGYGACPKWFGNTFGYGGVATWPAMRLGGALPVQPQQVSMQFDLNSIRGAVSARVLATAPDGTQTQTDCAASPCAVTVDGRQGNYLFRIQYLSAGGGVLATTRLPILAGR